MAQDLPQQSSPAAKQQPLQVTTEIVKLDATVTDERGEFISGLRQSDFRILDRGAEQPIVFFAPTDAPAQILVMVETSPAVYLIQSDHIAAVYSLARGLAPDDEIALVTYNDAPRTILPFTQDKASLTATLEQIQYTLGFGDLNLFDSISAVLDSLAPATGKKAILLLTTGLDSSPASHWDALVQKLRSSDVVIYPVALGTALRAPAKKKQEQGPLHSRTFRLCCRGQDSALPRRHYWRPRVFPGISQRFRSHVSRNRGNPAPPISLGHRPRSRRPVSSAYRASPRRKWPAVPGRRKKFFSQNFCPRGISGPSPLGRII